MNPIANQRGFSLVELLVSLTLTMAFAAVLQTFSRTILHGAGVLEVASETQEAARIGVQLVTRDLRGAGFHARGGSLEAIPFARADAVGISMDLNGDGDVSDSNEKIAYSFDAEKQALMRTLGDGSPQPMLNDLAPDGLYLSYFDASGNLLPVGETGLADADRASVRRIDVTLRIESPNPDPANSTPLRREQSGTVWLRNG
jgi:type II secretory pathway pseudopilin PulG